MIHPKTARTREMYCLECACGRSLELRAAPSNLCEIQQCPGCLAVLRIDWRSGENPKPQEVAA